MRRFELVRDVDVSGVSGIGTVAEGVEFGDGKVVLRWHGAYVSTEFWDSIEDVVHVHGHDGLTRLLWLDDAPAAS